MNWCIDGYINGSIDRWIVVRSMEWYVDKWIDGMTTPEKKDHKNKRTPLTIIIISSRKMILPNK